LRGDLSGTSLVELNDLRLVVDSLDTLRTARFQLSSWLKSEGVADDAADGLVLAAHEALANAVSHSRSSQPPLLDVQRVGNLVTVEVRDRGEWSPVPHDHPGLGLAIIQAIPGSSIESSTTGTTVRLVQTLD